MSTIREQIITAITTKLTEISIASGYATNIGARVERVRPVFQPVELPAISITPQPETAERLLYGMALDMPMVVEGFALHGMDNPSIVAEKILGDLITCLTGVEQTMGFISGGTYEIMPGDTIVGATSTATARVVAITLTSGTWIGGDAAGSLRLRLQFGVFQAENLNVGIHIDVATISGDSIRIPYLGGIIDDIYYVGGGPGSYPDSGQDITGCPAMFTVRYRTEIGNPSE